MDMGGFLPFFPGHIHAFYLEYIYFDRRDHAMGGIMQRRAPGKQPANVAFVGRADINGTTNPKAWCESCNPYLDVDVSGGSPVWDMGAGERSSKSMIQDCAIEYPTCYRRELSAYGSSSSLAGSVVAVCLQFRDALILLMSGCWPGLARPKSGEYLPSICEPVIDERASTGDRGDECGS
ncbi:MAG: hypothetical protein Q9163_002777 [Psora crenata]